VALLAWSGSPPANFDTNGSRSNEGPTTAATPTSVSNADAPTAILNVLFRISPPDEIELFLLPDGCAVITLGCRQRTLRRCKECRQEERLPSGSCCCCCSVPRWLA